MPLYTRILTSPLPVCALAGALLVLSLGGCASRQPTPAGAVDRPATHIVSALHSAWEKGDWAAWRNLFAADARIEMNGSGPLDMAAAVLLQVRMRRGLAELTLPAPVDMPLLADSSTWLRYRARWSLRFKGSDERVGIPVSIAMRLAEGRIAELTMDWDTLPFVISASDDLSLGLVLEDPLVPMPATPTR